MMNIEMAANAAAEALRRSDRKDHGLVIHRIAEEYGVDTSELGRELGRRRRKENMTVWLDMDRVKALGCGGDLGKIARYCDLGHDTLRIAEGRNGKGVQRRTVEKIARKFGKEVKDLLHDENRQEELKEIKTAVWDENGITFFTGDHVSIQVDKDSMRLLKVMAVYNDIDVATAAARIISAHLKAIEDYGLNNLQI